MRSLIHLALLTILVRNYDEAIAFYTGMVGFDLVEDTDLGGGKRWVRVAPPSRAGAPTHTAGLLLAQGTTPEQRAIVGKQTGGRVMAFLHTDDFDRDHAAMQKRGVRFVRPPRREPYGTVAVFEDLYGNLFDLIGPSQRDASPTPHHP